MTASTCCKGRLVIYPLRWDPDAALSPDEQSTLTEAELGLLSDEAEEPPEPEARPPGEVTAKNCSDMELIEGIAGIFIADGNTSEVAEPKAAGLIEKYGQEQCQRQFDVFARRCELAQASEEGLRNPSELFIRSVQQDWPPPPDTRKKPPKTWYTDEEYELLLH